MARLPLGPMVFLAALSLAACTPAIRTDMPERLQAELPGELPRMSNFGTVTVQAPARPNTEIAADFLDLSFAMESGRRVERMSRFEGPVTVDVVAGAPRTLEPDLERLIARLRSEAEIDIRRATSDATPANITIETIPRERLQRVVPQAACFVVPRVSSWSEFRSASARAGRDLDWTTLDTRERVAIFIPSDVPPQEVRDCLNEELAQALGPLNDIYHLPDSVFNDDNFHAILTGFDMLILRAYYDDSLRSGMTRADVAQRLPEILDRLNPGGRRGAARAPIDTSRPWITAIETALVPGGAASARIQAAERAVTIARNADWQDVRLGFSHFALGRLTLSSDVERSIAAFQIAGGVFERLAPGGIQSAHVDMQLAAFTLSSGRADDALRLTGRAMPAATRAQNAALLSTLMMIRAEALDDLGRTSEARQVRIDSLSWGRYGFGPNAALGARLTEVAALSPRR